MMSRLTQMENYDGPTTKGSHMESTDAGDDSDVDDNAGGGGYLEVTGDSTSAADYDFDGSEA